MKNIRMLSRVLVGIVFIFSGFVKAVDPLGFTYKFVDYFNAFGIGFLEPLAFPLAVVLSNLELVLGIALLLSCRMKFSAWTLMLFMSFFTILTLILALTNPVHDCGCFGDALVLTNWQTFWKNVVLMVFTIIVFFGRNAYIPVRPPRVEWGILVVFFSGAVLFSVYCFHYLPVLDFRPYQVGTNIPDAMSIPDGAPESVFETRLYYRNKDTGMEKEFTMDNFPKDSLKWEFVDAQTALISEGYEPPIHDFNIMSPDGSEVTEDIIHFKGYTFFLVAYDALMADSLALKAANDWYRLSQALPDIRFFAVSSTVRSDLDSLRKSLQLEYDFSQADEITLKTIIRSNPGLVLIKNGTIIGKWAYRNFPQTKSFPAFNEITSNFPFCPGCDLRIIHEPPVGSAPDEYSTLLYYRNASDGILQEFTMENFPTNDPDWVFENSSSNKVSSGFLSPLDNFSFRSMDGLEQRDLALFNNAYSLLIFMRDPSGLSSDQFRSVNKFAAMGAGYLNGTVDIFGITPLSPSEVADFTAENIPAFDFYTATEAVFESMAGNPIQIVLLEEAKVIYQFRGSEAPDPSILSENHASEVVDTEIVLQPWILDQLSAKKDKQLVYIFILGFLLITMLIRLYFSQKSRDA